MDIVSETTEDGIVERRFDLKVDQDVVPGIHWLPENASAPHPTVLVGHGGTQHKRVANVLGMAQLWVKTLGYGVVALDAPGHGDRMTDAEREAQRQRFANRGQGGRGAGGRLPAPPAGTARSLSDRAPKHVGEWKALLDDLQTNDRWAAGPFGYWGVSMGCAFGMPLVAGEPRIKAAVLGLAGMREGNEAQLKTANKITVPLLFLFQWHDELMTRDSGLALWDAFGSTEKTMHINPGPHVGIPLFEREAAARFFKRHLG